MATIQEGGKQLENDELPEDQKYKAVDGLLKTQQAKAKAALETIDTYYSDEVLAHNWEEWKEVTNRLSLNFEEDNSERKASSTES